MVEFGQQARIGTNSELSLDAGRESRHVLATFLPRLSVRHGRNETLPPLPRCPRDPAMRTYLITYDTAAPSRHSVASAIMQLGDAWARPLDNTWYVQSTDRVAVLESRLKSHLDSEDG